MSYFTYRKEETAHCFCFVSTENAEQTRVGRTPSFLSLYFLSFSLFSFFFLKKEKMFLSPPGLVLWVGVVYTRTDIGGIVLLVGCLVSRSQPNLIYSHYLMPTDIFYFVYLYDLIGLLFFRCHTHSQPHLEAQTIGT